MSAGFASHSLYCSKSAPILFDLLIIPANAPGVNFAWAFSMPSLVLHPLTDCAHSSYSY
jgi:hypothetical protein